MADRRSALNKALRERRVNRRIANRQREWFRLPGRHARRHEVERPTGRIQVPLQTPMLEDSAAVRKHRLHFGAFSTGISRSAVSWTSASAAGAVASRVGASAVGGTCDGLAATSGQAAVDWRPDASPTAFGRRAGSGAGNKAWYPYRTTKERTTASRTRFSIGVRRAAAGPERDQRQRRRVGDIEPGAPRPSRPRGRRRGVESPRPHSPNTTGGSGTIRRRGATTAVCRCGAPQARDVEPESVARDHRSAAARRAAARRQAPRKSSSRLVNTASNSSRRGITRMSTGRPACGG